MLSFKLSDDFVGTYTARPVPWGFRDAAGNSVGELVFVRTYSRLKADGTKETWQDVCRRVIEGMFSIQKDWAQSNRLPWSDVKAQRTAEDAFERMFSFKWTPPGRGLWMLGTPLVHEQRNSAALQNCAFVSTGSMTKTDPAAPFAFLMEASMLGIGVGFDTEGAKKDFQVYEPGHPDPKRVAEDLHYREYLQGITWQIPDTREGWVKSVVLLLEAYLKPAARPVLFDYSEIRPAGAPIKTFGGTAAGPEPLQRLHSKLREILDRRAGGTLDSTAILDIGNLIGVCVVSGNVRRSAELALGSIDDEDFLNAKNYEAKPERAEWGWMSNNSVRVNVGDDLSRVVDGIRRNGEPGIVWMDLSRSHGRLIDPANNKDHRAAGYNPCFHPDTLVETVDGPKRIADIAEPTLVYTKGADGRLTVRKASAAFQTRKNAETLRISLQNGDELIVTPEHKIMLRDGTWVEAKELRPGSALEVLCRARRGWRYSGVRLGSQHPKEQVMEHRLIWEGVHGPIPEGYDVDHINRDHHDNRIDNLRILPHSEHARLSRTQVPNDHQVHGPNGDFAPSGNRGKKLREGAINPPRATNWVNQSTVVAVTAGPVTDVWDITVDDTHCLIANGVVAHNCAEQTLESFECCTLVETYLNRHESLEDYKKTLKIAYLYAKTVTLLPTHWARTNAIMQRNRRIGTSMSGIANFADRRGLAALREWMDAGYETVQHYDEVYSEWLCVRESIKTTTVKPSGTVSILAGESPGAHWAPGGEYFDRRVRYSKDDPVVTLFRWAGYSVEPAFENPETTVVVTFPIHSLARRSEKDVTIFEKANLAAMAQRHWSDNSVSVTLSFDPDAEGDHIGTVLAMHEGQLKTASFLPMAKGTYQQMPYEEITAADYEAATMRLMPVDLAPIYAGEALDAVGESFCSTDSCEVKSLTSA